MRCISDALLLSATGFNFVKIFCAFCVVECRMPLASTGAKPGGFQSKGEMRVRWAGVFLPFGCLAQLAISPPMLLKLVAGELGGASFPWAEKPLSFSPKRTAWGQQEKKQA